MLAISIERVLVVHVVDRWDRGLHISVYEFCEACDGTDVVTVIMDKTLKAWVVERICD